MRLFIWFIRIVLFVLLFVFAIKNQENAKLYFFLDKQWPLPLAFIIFGAFAVGMLMGVTATITSLLRQRREISRLRKQLDQAELAADRADDARLPGPF